MALGGRQVVLPYSLCLLCGWQFSGELFPAVLRRGGEPKVLLLCHLESPPLSRPILEALWGASKLAKAACSGCLAPRFVSKDEVTVERTCSAAHMRHHVLAWPCAPSCERCACVGFALKALAAAAPRLHCGDIMVILRELMLWLRYSSVTVRLGRLLRLPSPPGERLCCGRRASQERINVSAVPRFLASSSRLLALPTPSSANSVNSKTIGVTNRISDIGTKETRGLPAR